MPQTTFRRDDGVEFHVNAAKPRPDRELYWPAFYRSDEEVGAWDKPSFIPDELVEAAFNYALSRVGGGGVDGRLSEQT